MGLLFDTGMSLQQYLSYAPTTTKTITYSPIITSTRTISPSTSYIYSPQIMMYSPYGSQTKKESSVAETTARAPEISPSFTYPFDINGGKMTPQNINIDTSNLLIVGLVVVGGIILLKMFSD